ncbi:MAG: divergent polysaccharide deacetylase family protein [Candidatus Omnitrophica bacterium]|nr:divergent polysaccharide deacetylase family protein [Candidatus Omnitrophota bacterium]
MKKFLRDYPVVLLVTVIFALGIGTGYFLGAHKGARVREVRREVVKPEEVKQVAIASPAPAAGLPEILPKPFLPSTVIQEGAAITEKLVQPQMMGKRPWKPKIVFVIDDAGYNKKHNDLLFSIDRPMTLAILPLLPYSTYFAEEGKKHGLETVLHLPLEPENGEDPGPGAIQVNMSSSRIRSILNQDLASVPGVIGVNNHMGSRATRDRTLMYLILRELKKRKLLFLDSMTHPDSVAHNVAFAVDIPSFERDVFLDNEDDFNHIVEQIEQAAQVAKQVGKAIAIGHFRENTLRAIKAMIPELEARGYEIANLQGLI